MNELSCSRAITNNRRKSLARAVQIGEDHSASAMLETIAIVLVVLWLLGLVSSYTMGGFIHVLLVLALITILFRVVRGNSPVA